MFYYANMCLHNNNDKYVAMLPEEDFLDTFALQLFSGSFDFTPQYNPFLGIWSQYAHISLPSYDSIFISKLPLPGTGPMTDGWPTLNDKKFLFYFYSTIKHENRDTLYARLRWICLGSGEDLQAPVDFKMHIPKRN